MKTKLLLAILTLCSGLSLIGQIPSNIPQIGLVAWFPFNGNAHDESGNGFDGQIQNGTVLSTDRFNIQNSAYFFDGMDDHIALPGQFNNGQTLPEFTISAWFKKSGQSDGIIWGKSGFWKEVVLSTNSQDQISFFYAYPEPQTYHGLSSGIPFNVNNWNHIVIKQENSIYYSFLNGVLIQTGPTNNLTNWGQDNGGCSTGGNFIGMGRYCQSFNYQPFNGLIDDIGFWNRALSDAEITSLYNSYGTPCTASSNTLNTTITDGQTYSFNGQTLTSAGTYTATLQNAVGCDSVVTLNLEVNSLQTSCNIEASSQSVCFGESADLSISENGFTPCAGSNSSSPQWELLFPASSFNGNEVNFKPGSFDKSNSKIYSVLKTGSVNRVYCFDLNTNQVIDIPSNGGPGELSEAVYDFTNQRIVANRVGRDAVFTLPTSGGTWSQIGTGSFDAESYGANTFWNPINQRFSYFGGYGYFALKNWIWENNGSGWQNTYANNNNCTPGKRGGQFSLNAAGDKIQIFSGQGSCDGNQFASTCSLGSPWASDVGVYCWFRDIWELDLNTLQFSNVLPVNSQSISREGAFAYDYENDDYYIIGGFVPSGNYSTNVNNYGNTWSNEVLRFKRGEENGFSPISVSGTIPPVSNNSIGNGTAIYDANYNRIILARKDGIWALNLSNRDKSYSWSTGETTPTISVSPTETTTYSVTVNQGTQTCSSDVTITVNQPTTSSINASITEGESYSFNGQTLTSAGTYSATLQNAAGCDSVVTLNLVVEPIPLACSVSSSNNAICNGESKTLEIQTNPALQFSDSRLLVAEYNLTFEGPFNYSLATEIGEVYEIEMNGVWAVHCDNNGQMDAAYAFNQGPAIVNPQFMSWNGSSIRPSNDFYNSSHKYVYSNLIASQASQNFGFIDNPYGDNCGSLNMKIYKISNQLQGTILWSTGETTPTISVSPTETTTYNVTVSQGTQTCSSDVTITVNQPTTSSINASITEGESYSFNGQTLTSAGTYSATLQNAAGCDSVVTLNSTIMPAVEPLNCEIISSNSNVCPNTDVTLSIPSNQLGTLTQTNSLGQEIPGYTFKGMFNGHGYYMANTPGTWTSANQNAVNAGGHLASINSEEEQQFIANLTLENLWIGFTRNVTTNQWEWVTSEPVSYTNWRGGEPNGYGANGERFAHMITDNCFGPNQWNDLNDIDWNGTCYSNCYRILEIGSISNAQILWSTGETTPTISVSPTETTTYSVTVTQGTQTCTSDVTITVNQPTTETVNASITDGETYSFNGQNLTTAGTYTATLQNAAGCDSVVTLNLTVNPAPVAGCYAASVVNFNQGPNVLGSAVPSIRSNATQALGQPEAVVTNVVNFVSLGFGGTITVAFETPIANGAGNDIRLDEATWGNNPCSRYPEKADVFASQDGTNFVYLGQACQDASFDLGTLSWAKYIRLVDVSDILSFNADADGYDLNGIECLNGSATNPTNDGLEACTLQEIVSYTPGTRKNGTAVPSPRNNANNALGMPQSNNTVNFVSLGFGGSLVAKFDYVVFNQPGNDLQVTETSFGNPSCTSYPEKARVSLSLDNQNWVEFGELCQDGTIEMGAMPYAQYIRIQDATPMSSSKFNGAADGYDVDAVVVLNNGCGAAAARLADADNTTTPNEESGISVFPNPMQEFTTIRFDNLSEDAEFTLELFDGAGRLIQTQKIEVSADMPEFTMKASDLAHGIYQVVIHNETIRFMQRLVK